MAITPRTILTSAAPATVAVVSLYFFTVLGTVAFTSLTDTDKALAPGPQTSDTNVYSSACANVANTFGEAQSEWSEFAWIKYTHCYDQNSDSEAAIAAASEGLRHYPRSEMLYNFKGYHQIVQGEHAQAIDTLREGMGAVAHQRNGVMTNNLAWAGLWEPRQMRPDEARELYVQSLSRSPGSCETLHTGLFVEFTIAGQSNGLERYEALKRVSELRNRYTRCLDRIDGGDWNTVVEIVGAAAVFNSLDSAHSSDVQPILKRSTAKLMNDYSHITAEEVCSEAIPMADFHHHCVDAVESGMRANRLAARNHEERNKRAETSREILEQYGHDYPVIKKVRTNCVRR